MEENNILNKGVYMLYEIKDDLVRNNELKERAAVLAADEKKYSKTVENLKKKLSSEINDTISKRRNEIETSFSSRLNSTRSKMKKAQSKRTSEKNSKVTKRIEDETVGLREALRVNQEEIRSIFTRNNIPKIFNNAFSYALHRPLDMKDYGIMALTVLAILIAPVIFCNLFLPDSTLLVVLAYVLVLGISGGLYYFVYKKVYAEHRKEMKEVSQCRKRIKSFKQKIAKKKQKIRKDSDESGYELEKYDEEIRSIQEQIDLIVDEKKNALDIFENQTKRALTDNINQRYAPDIEENSRELERTREERHQADSELNELTVKISKNYEAYLGKEILSVNIIDSMIDIMNDGNAETIADAVEYYRSTVDKGLQTL